MSRSFLDPQLFKRANKFSMAAQWAWYYLVTNRRAQEVPGLLESSPALIAVERYLPLAEVERAIKPLLDARFLLYDEEEEVFRIPCMPEFCPRPGPNQVLGWYRDWVTLPESDLKYEHLVSLRAIVPGDTTPTAEAWKRTFGTHFRVQATTAVPIRITDTQPALPNLFNKNGTHKATVGGRVSELTDPDPDPDPPPDQDQETDQEGSAEGRSQPPRITHAPVDGDLRARSLRLWERQEQERALIPGTVRLPAAEENLERVEDFLVRTGATDELIHHALKVLRDDAVRDPSKVCWINGVNNWKSNVFNQAAGATLRRSGPKNGHHFPSSEENYNEGGVEVPELGPGVRQMR